MEKTVSQKMGIKPGQRALLVHAPEQAIEDMQLPELDRKETLTGEFDYIHFFAKTQADFHQHFPRLKKHLAPAGSLWLSWPKGGQLDTDLDIKSVIRIGYEYGLVESKNLRINDVWTALKFTHPKKGKTYHNSYGTLKE